MEEYGEESDVMLRGVVLGFFTGTIIGAALAMLYTPKSGKELRRDIRVGTGDFLDGAKTLLGKTGERTAEVLERAADRSRKLGAELRGTAEKSQEELHGNSAGAEMHQEEHRGS